MQTRCVIGSSMLYHHNQRSLENRSFQKRLGSKKYITKLNCTFPNVSMHRSDVAYMDEALIEAKCAFEKEEVPVGALIVHEGQIISRSHNQTETLLDPTAHAEILCIRDAARKLRNWRLTDCTLFVTLEPCAMCVGAILQSRIPRLVYGTKSPLLGACGSWIDLSSTQSHAFHPQIEITGGICEEESKQLLKQFYKSRRMRRG